MIRRVVAVRGHMRFVVDVAPRFDYARARHEVELSEHGALFRSPAVGLSLSTRCPLEVVNGGDVRAHFAVRAGETATFVLDCVEPSEAPVPYSDADVAAEFDATVVYWRRWLRRSRYSRSRYSGRWREMVHRSALTLGFDHRAVADDHRDVAVPHRQVARSQRTAIHGRADVLLLRQPRNVQSRFVIRPLRQPAAIQGRIGWPPTHPQRACNVGRGWCALVPAGRIGSHPHLCATPISTYTWLMKLAAAASVLLLCALTACGRAEESNEGSPAQITSMPAVTTTTAPPPAAPPPFTVSSPAFADNTEIPADYSCNGRNVPPPLRWEHVPADTESVALVVDDPDAVGGLYIHWIVTGIPPSTSEIIDGVLPEGAQVGSNSGGQAAYLGPCPPSGTGLHHYRFQLYALGEPLPVAPTAPASEASQAIADAATAAASTVGLFSG